jgi:hypothetical protein
MRKRTKEKGIKDARKENKGKKTKGKKGKINGKKHYFIYIYIYIISWMF